MKNQGFSQMELVLVIAVIGALSYAGTRTIRPSQSKTNLANDAAKVVEALSRAKAMARSGNTCVRAMLESTNIQLVSCGSAPTEPPIVFPPGVVVKGFSGTFGEVPVQFVGLEQLYSELQLETQQTVRPTVHSLGHQTVQNANFKETGSVTVALPSQILHPSISTIGIDEDAHAIGNEPGGSGPPIGGDPSTVGSNPTNGGTPNPSPTGATPPETPGNGSPTVFQTFNLGSNSTLQSPIPFIQYGASGAIEVPAQPTTLTLTKDNQAMGVRIFPLAGAVETLARAP
ncbi:MAG: Tfp pilus assembly protein FimT/FimU [Bacteriovoracia bacterium]